MSNQKLIDILLIQPNKPPRQMKMADELKAIHKLVEGRFEVYRPFYNDLVIICNEEGKLRNLPMNREICNDDGMRMDIIRGDFFFVNAPLDSESFQSLSPKEVKGLSEKFKHPEKFHEEGGRIHVSKIPIKSKAMER